MKNIKKITSYLKYNGFDKSYIVKILFLLDWKHVLVTGERMFSVNWIYSSYGAKFEEFEIDNIIPRPNIELLEEEKEYIDFILKKVRRLKYTDFVNIYFSTYPLIYGVKYQPIDLVAMAKEYKAAFPRKKPELERLAK